MTISHSGLLFLMYRRQTLSDKMYPVQNVTLFVF